MADTDIDTGARSVLSRSYLVSIPERTARAGAALTGGLVYETTEVMLPLAVRRSRLYQAIVGRLLRIMIELVGGVEGVYPAQEMPVRELLVRKTAGNVVELSSFMAVGWSPVWLLAGAADLVGVRRCTCGRSSESYARRAYSRRTRRWHLSRSC